MALVKALGFENETADGELNDTFSDSGIVSTALTKYVALTYKHNLMEGNDDKNGSRVFDPQGTLTRAAAAMLLYNAFKQNEEKITFDEEKVSFDEELSQSESESQNQESTDLYPVPVVTASISEGKVAVSWNKNMSSKFQGYKVVVSKYDSTPAYPENGYFQWITDRETYSIVLRQGTAIMVEILAAPCKQG
ncbi:MAG: S-layer homology domain-containing protein [Clostridiales bacterium]|nr:S-layer homology domain-containing protein [Clostridiales bacterium]